MFLWLLWVHVLSNFVGMRVISQLPFLVFLIDFPVGGLARFYDGVKKGIHTGDEKRIF